MRALAGLGLPPSPGAGPKRLSPCSSSRTHLGRVRTINEDRVLDCPELSLWAVADGMGGQSCGDVAAETMIRGLSQLDGPVGRDALLEAIDSANLQIYRAMDGRSGTTLVLLSIHEGKASLWWIGDSRAYLIRGDRAQLITRDHSLVQELVDAGVLDEVQASNHPQANVITRAIGIAPQAELECQTIELAPGDRILLCSDGLSRSLDAGDLNLNLPVTEHAGQLLNNALERDGTDNISLVLVHV